MTLEQTITADIATAMKAREQQKLSALRMLKAALMNKSVEKGRPLEPGEDLQVVSALVKQRRDAIEQFTAGQRSDLADKERAEIAILEGYLPPPVTEAEMADAVRQAIAETGATSSRDMGKVMKATMARLAGKTVDGREIGALVKAALSS